MESFALEQIKENQSQLIRKVYAWMCTALLITAATAWVVAGNDDLVRTIFSTRFTFFGIIIAQFAIVWFLSARIQTLTLNSASLLFVLYSFITGLTLSVVFLAYTSASITSTFLITAGTFGAMSIYGFTTKRDLTSFGNLFFMALLGLIIASVVNYFMQSEMLYWIISFAGVLIFVGLTAYDTQKIKSLLNQPYTEENQKLAILGALILYLDFINLFLYLLRIFGRRK